MSKAIEDSFTDAGIDTYRGVARFIGEDTIEVDGKWLNGKKILVATGARPRKLELEGAGYLTTSEEFLEMERMPESVIFVGGGYISFELAHIAVRAGASVIILHRSDRPLKQFDPELVDMLLDASREAGIEVITSMPVNSIGKKGAKRVVNAGEGGKKFDARMVVHGAGRVPQIGRLDLDIAGVEYSSSGIVVNEYLQSISNPRVYAAGDAASLGLPLTPVAGLEGHVAAENIMEGNNKKVDPHATPSVVFTLPPLAMVGMQESRARTTGWTSRIHLPGTLPEE